MTVACLSRLQIEMRCCFSGKKADWRIFPFSVVCCLLETNLNPFALDNKSAAIRSLWWLVPVSVTTLRRLLHRSSSWISSPNCLSHTNSLSFPHHRYKVIKYEVTRHWNIVAVLLAGYHHLACCLMNNTLTGLYTDIVVMCSIFYDTLGHWDRCNTDSVSHILWLSAPLPPS